MRPLTKRNLKQHWPGRQQGAVLVLVVIALAAMLLMGALALDGGHMLLNKTRLQNAVDAAALSGAKNVAGDPSVAPPPPALAREASFDTPGAQCRLQGNGELGQAIGTTAAAVGGYTEVTFSNSVYGAFSSRRDRRMPRTCGYRCQLPV